MIEKKLSSLSPLKLRMVLLLTIVAMIILSAVGFWFFKDWLGTYASTVSADAQKAKISSSDIATLQRLKTQLENNTVAVNRTKNIVADSKSYAYQNQIIDDIDAYAKSSGVTIAGYGFATTDSAAAPSAAATPAPAGLKTTSINITIKNPVKYQSIMSFIHAIEANLTKMQLTGVTLRQDTATGGDMVSIDPLTVEVYIR